MTFGCRHGIAACTVALMLAMGPLAPSASAQRQEMLDKTLMLTGHLLIQPLGSPLTDWKQIADRVAKIEGVRIAAPLVEGQALASSPTNFASVLIRGIRAADLARISLVVDHLQQGTLEDFDGSPGVVIGTALADQLSLRAGDSVTLTAPRGAGADPALRIRSYKVVAVFGVGASKYVGAFVFMPLIEAQSYFDHIADVMGIEVHLTEADAVAALRQRVTDAAGRPILLTDWCQRNAAFSRPSHSCR